MFDRRLIQYFNWGFLCLVIAIAAMGVTTLYGAVAVGPGDAPAHLYYKQIAWYGIGLLWMMAVCMVDYRWFNRGAYPIYLVCVGMLVAVLMVGRYGGGSRRWLALGPLTVQPSEMMKIAVVFVLARYYAQVLDPRGLTLRELIKPALLVGLPFVLIVRQPDLGTALMILIIAATLTLFVRIERRTLLLFILTGMVSGPLVWSQLKGYQRQRILTFLDPDRDPLGAGYHIIQSKIAIGSGQLWGKGIFEGTQNILSFLPEQHTDFIFSVWAEGMGFVGSLAVILAFLVLIVWGLRIAYSCRDPFGTMICVGVTAILFWQIMINVGMVMGLMPVVGMPLPFVSYGGSSIVAVMICAAVLMNVSMRRFIRDDHQGVG